MPDEGALWSTFWARNTLARRLVTCTPTYFGVTRYLGSLPLPEKAKILDAGCGTGKLASFWHSRGHDVLGIDISDEALALTAGRGIPTRKADIQEGLPFGENHFDLVYSDGLLEHFTRPAPLLTELSRVCRRHLVTFVPRLVLYSDLTERLFRPPTEYRRPDDEWIRLHEGIPHTALSHRKIPLGLLAIRVDLEK